MLKKLALAAFMATLSTSALAHHHGDHGHDEAATDNHSHHTHEGHSSAMNHAGATIEVNDKILIENAKVKATIPGVKVSSGYFSITNRGESTLRLVAAETSSAKHTEFHRMYMRDSKMAMRKVDFIEVEPKQTFELTPGGFHLMFMGVKQQLKPDTSLMITLVDQNGERYEFSMPIVASEKK